MRVRNDKSDPRYRTARWLRMRASQLSRHPLCVLCLCGVCEHKEKVQGRKIHGRLSVCITEATVVDHVVPHRGDALRFWDHQNLQSLCANCHSKLKQLREQHSDEIDSSGWCR